MTITSLSGSKAEQAQKLIFLNQFYKPVLYYWHPRIYFQKKWWFSSYLWFLQTYYDNVTMYWYIFIVCFWSFRSDKVQMFEHNRCSDFLYSWFSWISRRIIIYEAHDDILSEMYSWLPLPYSKIRATQNYKELYF